MRTVIQKWDFLASILVEVSFDRDTSLTSQAVEDKSSTACAVNVATPMRLQAQARRSGLAPNAQR